MLYVLREPAHFCRLLTQIQRLREHHDVLHSGKIYLYCVMHVCSIFVQEDCTLATFPMKRLKLYFPSYSVIGADSYGSSILINNEFNDLHPLYITLS